jgi:TP901-1 family phage major tail protein
MADTTIKDKVIRGVELLLYAGETAIGGQKSTSISMSADTIDASCKDAGDWYINISGPKQWSASCDGIVYLNDEGYKAAVNAFMNSTAITAVFKNEAKTIHYEGEAYITSLDLDAPYEDLTSYSMEVSGAGKLEDKTTTTNPNPGV